MLKHEARLNKFKKIVNISNIFREHSGIKLEINNNRKMENFTSMFKLKNALLNNHLLKEEI